MNHALKNNQYVHLILSILFSGVLAACSTADYSQKQSREQADLPQKQSREPHRYTIGDPDDELLLIVSEGASALGGPHVVLKENRKVNLFGVDFVFSKGVLTATKNGEEERFTSPGSYYMYVTPETGKWKSGRSMPSFEGIVHSSPNQDDAARRKLEDSLPELTRAVKANSMERVNELLAKGENVNVRDENGYTPLHEARSVAVARLLIKHGADVNARDERGSTPLHWAETAGLASLLIRQGAAVEARDVDGCTPLHVAARAGRPDVVRLLIARGADVKAKGDGGTPLDCAERNADDGELPESMRRIARECALLLRDVMKKQS